MRRITTKVVSVLAIVTMVGGIAWASSVHFKGRSGPAAFDNGLTLTISGLLAGLGNGDLLITLTARADTSTTCTNQGGNQAPGQNPGDVTVSGAVAVPGSEIKNGNVSFTVKTTEPPQPTSQEAGCANTNWSAAFTDLAFTSAVLAVTQKQSDGAFLTVLSANIALSEPTEDGAVPSGNITITIQ